MIRHSLVLPARQAPDADSTNHEVLTPDFKLLGRPFHWKTNSFVFFGLSTRSEIWV